MKNILRMSAALVALTIALPVLRAQNAAPAPAAPAAPAATESTLVINLPASLKVESVVSAVSKGFTAHNWAEVATAGNTVTASHSQGGVSVKATAVCTATEVKVSASYTTEGKITPAKAQAAVQRWLRSLEKSTKENLGLAPQKGDKKKKAE